MTKDVDLRVFAQHFLEENGSTSNGNELSAFANYVEEKNPTLADEVSIKEIEIILEEEKAKIMLINQAQAEGKITIKSLYKKQKTKKKVTSKMEDSKRLLMKSIKRSTALIRYPDCGRIVKCSHRGYGFVDRVGKQDFLHLTAHPSRSFYSMEEIEGKYCAYVIGGCPKKYLDDKPDWNNSVVEWILLDELGGSITPNNYLVERKDAIEAMGIDSLYSVLSADWYIKLWRKTTGHSPKYRLRPGNLLTTFLKNSLARTDGVDNLIELLLAVLSSPWYGLNIDGQTEVFKCFFQPEKWQPSVFSPSKTEKLLKKYENFWLLYGKDLMPYIIQARTVAIDLELPNDSSPIFQFGWKNSKGIGLRSNLKGLTMEELSIAVEECLFGQEKPCVVGHNLLFWDWPILQKNKAPFPESSTLWDTLIASWILKPWDNSHALIVKDKAHQADADAKECYKLFKMQISQLAPCLSPSDFIYGYDIRKLINALFNDPSLLTKAKWRSYPSNLYVKNSAPCLYPEGRISEINWQKNCHLEFLSSKNRLKDPLLSPEICREIALKEQTIKAKAISIIISDAARNDVEVRLSLLPQWLADDELKVILRNAHQEYIEVIDDEAQVFYVAEDMFRLKRDKFNSFFENETITVKYANSVLAAWQKVCRKNLNEKQISRIYPDVVRGWRKRTLLPIRNDDGTASYLLYEPPGFGEKSTAWKLLTRPPMWLTNILSVEDSSIQTKPSMEKWTCVPHWQDGELRELEVERMFISPDTANRRQYLSDLLLYILNLMIAIPENTVLLLAMPWKAEAQKVQQDLVRLSRTTQHSNSPLRQLEHIFNKGFRVQVCHYKDLPKYIEASNSFGIKVQVVIDEVPLHDWFAILPSENNANPMVNSFNDAEIDEKELLLRKKEHIVPVDITSQEIKKVISIFLIDWLQGLLNTNSNLALPIIILDIRLTRHNEIKLAQLPQKKIPFYALEELLKDDEREIFDKILYPHVEQKDIPNDYETYRTFLKENWGHEDFRPGPQKLAIEKLIQTKDDILVRLPTGGGKSIIFHLPALLRSQYSGRLTVVITPLRALMLDQVESLRKANFIETVDFLSGGRDTWINYDVYQGILDGRIKLVFVAPERFRVTKFVDVLERRRKLDNGLEFLVFDETHCISEWGFEFRPDYLYTAKYIAEQFKSLDLPGNPHRLLLTSATVTERNRKDLEKELELGKTGSYENMPVDMPHPIQPFIVLESFDLQEGEVADDEKFYKIIEVLEGLDLDKSAALVFVRRRKDCHILSEALNLYAKRAGSTLANLLASPFHAGLPEIVKKEAIDFLKNRIVNVLVCTKAFGMGMDIPHLHACIHHRPTTFIEEYLQEVGRIGRDEFERTKSGHELVKATLLYNKDDFEKNLGLLHDKAVSPPDIQDLFGLCLEKSISFEEIGKSVCMIPAKVQLSNDKKFDENQVSNSLFWLERMDVLTVEGKHPPYLDLSLDIVKLRHYENGSTLPSQVAKALLELAEESQSFINKLRPLAKEPKSLSEAETRFGRFVKGLRRGTLALMAPSRQNLLEQNKPTSEGQSYFNNESQLTDISISTSELISRCGEISLDGLFAKLLELSEADAIKVKKYFTIQKSGMPSAPDFWELLKKALELLTQPTSGKVELLSRKQFVDELQIWYQEFLLGKSNKPIAAEKINISSKSLVRQVEREVYRAINTSIKLMRFVDCELQESLSPENAIVYARQVPNPIRFKLERSVKDSISDMNRLTNYISNTKLSSSQEHDASFKILLTDVMAHMGSNMRISKLKELINLIEISGFYGFESDLNDWVSIVILNRQNSLEAHNPDSQGKSVVQNVYNDMLEKYELQVLRAQAMILFASMPVENRKHYIDRYFKCENSNQLKCLLEDTIGDVDEDVLANNTMLQELLGQVRKERYEKEIEKLNESQLRVCRSSYSSNLLVNAGPGTGKTHVLMMRCANLIYEQRVKPSEILVLAFNRAVVHEIRDRIRDLFRSLGYGSYTNKLDVSTFHSFALRYEKTTDLYDENAMGQSVHRFAEKIKNDKDFAQSISRKYKAILVDEFQDMNEDFYSVVKNLIRNCSGGGMVIGDDDQDILTWNRRKWQNNYNTECRLEAVEYFIEFRETFDPEEHQLTINYRSVSKIVDQAKKLIEPASEKIGFVRAKRGITQSIFRIETGVLKKLDMNSWPETLGEALSDGGNTAILCRSNKECRQIYNALKTYSYMPIESVNLLSKEDYNLYQLRHCGAMLDICQKRKDYDFVEQYIWEGLLQEYEQLRIADYQKDHGYLSNIYALICKETGRPRIRDISSFINETLASDIDKLIHNNGLPEKSARLTISTIHKVKGLQFDSVFIIPSSENFPFNERSIDITALKVDAAEEARLLYVAITRAQKRLYLGWEERERSWFNSRSYNSPQGSHPYVLEGSPKEVFISWPGQTKQVRNGLQNYIEKQVCLGAPLALKGKSIIHKSRIIGEISQNTKVKLQSAGGNPQLRASNIIRYNCGNYFKEKNPHFWESLDDGMKGKGWFYTVLVEEA